MKPKLRFKEFTDEWIEYVLQSESDVRDGTHDSPKYIEKGYPLITSKNLTDMGNLDFSNVSYLKQDDFDKINQRSKVDIGDILFGMIGTIGKPVRIDRDDFAIKNVALIKEKGLIKNDYLIHYLHTPTINKQFANNQDGGTQKFIALDKIRKLKIKMPSRKEQEKIVSLFNLLDKKIELQSKKIEDLKLFKKGLINNELNCLNNCQSVSLNDLGITYSGLSGKTKEDFENGNCKFINFMSVLKDNIDISSLTTVKINPNEKQNKVEKGDLFFMTSSETKEEVALCSTLSYDVKNLYLNSFCFGYRINDLNVINNEYLNCLLHSPKYRKQISNLGQGFTRVNISKNKLLELLIEVPDMKQQLRIVSINNKLNCKINLENEKLNKLSELKKGLMQKMFV